MNRKRANPADQDQHRTPLLFGRSDSALIPVHATLSTILPSLVSFLKINASRRRKQGGVKIALTLLPDLILQDCAHGVQKARSRAGARTSGVTCVSIRPSTSPPQTGRIRMMR